MKQILKSIVLATVVTASVITLSSFIAKKAPLKSTTADAYVISLESKDVVGANWVWTWKLTNPNPGNGQNGTLQDVSHWSVPLSLDAENALVAAEYSFDGVNWTSTSATLDRDPSIRACTSVDVLKYDVGTSGTNATYYRATFNQDFVINPFAKSWVKTGGGLQGCNLYYFSGTGARLD